MLLSSPYCYMAQRHGLSAIDATECFAIFVRYSYAISTDHRRVTAGSENLKKQSAIGAPVLPKSQYSIYTQALTATYNLAYMLANHRGVARGCVECRPDQAALASRDGVMFLDLGVSLF